MIIVEGHEVSNRELGLFDESEKGWLPAIPIIESSRGKDLTAVFSVDAQGKIRKSFSRQPQ
jgi:hypothetical protein